MFFTTGDSGLRTGPHLDARLWDPAGKRYLPLGKDSPYRRHLNRIIDSETGKPVTEAFLVTSEWDPARRHPVTGQVRPHHGVDFGTPIGRRLTVQGGTDMLYKFDEGGGGHMAIVPFADDDGRVLEMTLLHGSDANTKLRPYGAPPLPQPPSVPAPRAPVAGPAMAAATPAEPPPPPAWQQAAGAADRITDSSQQGYWQQAHIRKWADSNRELAAAAVEKVGGSGDWLGVKPEDKGAIRGVVMGRSGDAGAKPPDARRYLPTRRMS